MRRGIPELEDLGSLQGRRVLVRADLNVPLATKPDGAVVVADDFRLRASRPTIDWLRAQGAEVVVASHLGRPKGHDPALSMAPVREALWAWYPGLEVMENLRFDPREQANDPGFAEELARGFDAYVNDAFAVSHRRHASIVGVPALLPSAGGRNLIEEVASLGVLLSDPEHPYVAIVGGAKVSDKLGLLERLAERVDRLLVGGGLCFTLLAASGWEVGGSLVEEELLAAARRLLDTGKVLLPVDVRALKASEPFGRDGGTAEPLVFVQGVPEGYRGLDIGPGTEAAFARALESARTVFWNGPMGVFEDPRLRGGTEAVARMVAACEGYRVVGGGDSAAALRMLGMEGSVSHLSTGGGAALDYLEHGDLVGLAALRHSREQ